MNEPLNVAIFMHFHQPMYADPDDIIHTQPWVRLHAAREYFEMGSLLKDYPEIKATFSLSPCLVEQIEMYTNGEGYEDYLLRLMRLRTNEMKLEEKKFILSNIFEVYGSEPADKDAGGTELKDTWLGRMEREGLERACQLTTEKEMIDAQVLHLLSWSGAHIRNAPQISRFAAKREGFSIQERDDLLEAHDEQLKKIIPMYKELSSTGQVELATSPYYHPILPLLIDNDYGKIADRYSEESSKHFVYPDDAAHQISIALKYHEEVFGERSRGLWPPEGCICYEVLELAAKAGNSWLVTDEEVLKRSMKNKLTDDMKFRAYTVDGIENCPALFFRSSGISDAISHDYFKLSPKEAVNDLTGRLEQIRSSLPEGGNNWVVPIVLDAENPWEYYPDYGVHFFNELYSRLSESETLKTVSFSGFLEKAGNLPVLSNVQPGSIIDGNFNTWIGQEQKNRAWDVLTEAREVLRKISLEGGIEKTPFKEKFDSAYRNLLAAEGSDWFWWYGKSKSLPQSKIFDELFRSHLIKVYGYLNLTLPEELIEPLDIEAETEEAQPKSLLHPDIDGKVTGEDEWSAAGFWSFEEGTGQKAEHIIKEVKYGFDDDNVYIRLDGDSGIIRSSDESIFIELHLVKQNDALIRFSLSGDSPTLEFDANGVKKDIIGGSIAIHDIIEVRLPLEEINLRPNDKFYFFVRLIAGEEEVERLPKTGVIKATIPLPESSA